jgi:hypothetical protein
MGGGKERSEMPVILSRASREQNLDHDPTLSTTSFGYCNHRTAQDTSGELTPLIEQKCNSVRILNPFESR